MGKFDSLHSAIFPIIKDIVQKTRTPKSSFCSKLAQNDESTSEDWQE